MAKEIRYRRTGYVREYYQVNWTEADYKSLLQWLENKTEPHNVARYNVLKELSFDDIVAIFNDEKDDISYELPCSSRNHTWTYTEYVSDFIRGEIQEDAWNMGCYDSECYDSEDSIEIEEIED